VLRAQTFRILPDLVPLWIAFCLYWAMPRNRLKRFREPLGAREVAIIRRLRQVMKLPVPRIASAVDSNRSAIYDALHKNRRHGKRGRKGLRASRALNFGAPGLALPLDSSGRSFWTPTKRQLCDNYRTTKRQLRDNYVTIRFLR